MHWFINLHQRMPFNELHKFSSSCILLSVFFYQRPCVSVKKNRNLFTPGYESLGYHTAVPFAAAVHHSVCFGLALTWPPEGTGLSLTFLTPHHWWWWPHQPPENKKLNSDKLCILQVHFTFFPLVAFTHFTALWGHSSPALTTLHPDHDLTLNIGSSPSLITCMGRPAKPLHWLRWLLLSADQF